MPFPFLAIGALAAAASAGSSVYAATRKPGGQSTRDSGLSNAQESLHGPLAGYLQELLQRGGHGASQIEALFGPGGDPFTEQLAGSLYRNALQGPAMDEFNRTTRPEISSAFGNIGGTLSSRRGKTIADAAGQVTARSQAGLAGLLPQLLALRMGGIESATNLRRGAAAPAIAFATNQTQQVGQSPTSPWWGVLNNALGGLSTFAGIGAAGGFGGGGGGGSNVPAFNTGFNSMSFANTPRF